MTRYAKDIIKTRGFIRGSHVCIWTQFFWLLLSSSKPTKPYEYPDGKSIRRVISKLNRFSIAFCMFTRVPSGVIKHGLLENPPFLDAVPSYKPQFIVSFFNIFPWFSHVFPFKAPFFMGMCPPRSRSSHGKPHQWTRSPALSARREATAGARFGEVRLSFTGWWFQAFYIVPNSWDDDPIWLFFRGVQTTN